MKKVLALAAIVAMFAASSFAQDISFKNFKLYGEGSIIGIYEYDGINKGPKNYSGVYNQYHLGVMFDIHQNVQAKIALGYEPRWGDSHVEGKRIDTDDNSNSGYLNQVRVVEANLAFNNLFDVNNLKAVVGRQFYGDEDSTVMFLGLRRYNAEAGGGIFGYGETKITSIDSLVGYYEWENLKVNAMYGVLANDVVTGAENNSIMGFDVKYANVVKDMLDVQVYMYELNNADIAATQIAGDRYGIYGIKPTFRMNNLKASLEYANNYGGKIDVTPGALDPTLEEYYSNLIKIDASYKIEKVNLTPRGTYMVIGGFDQNKGIYKTFWNAGNYTPGLIFGQEVYCVDNLINYQIINAGVDYNIKKFSFALDYYNLTGRDAIDFGAGKHNIAYGEEIDLFVKYEYTENVEVFAGIAHMFTDSDLKDDDVSKGMLGVTYKIK